jgi:hypothetical protein
MKISVLQSLFITVLLLNSFINCSYGANDCNSSEISIDEYQVILEKIIKPDCASNRNNPSRFENIEIMHNKLSNTDIFTITLAPSIISNDPQLQSISFKYMLMKRFWRINNTNIRVFSVSGPPWIKHSPQRVLAMRDDNSTYLLAGFESRDFNKLVHVIIPSGSDVSGDLFSDICSFYLTNIYACGFYVKILNSLDDINFYEPRDTCDPFWNLMVKEHSENSENNQAIDNDRRKRLEFFKPAMVFHKPVLIVDRGICKLSLYTYFYGNGHIIEWNFTMGPDKEIIIKKNLAMPALLY